MKMLRTAAGLALAASLAMSAGCTNPPIQLKPVSFPIIPPAQLVQQICPLVKADIDLLVAPAGAALLAPDQQAMLADKIRPMFNAACKAGATVDLTNLQTFNETAFPLLVSILSGIPSMQSYAFGLTLAEPILNQIVADAIAASKASAATAPTAAAPK